MIEKVMTSKAVKNVMNTMAIENMFLSKDFVEELMKVERGEKTSEQLRKEILKKYTR